MPWQDQAACKGRIAEFVMPENNGPASRAKVANARAICAGCPVLDECREWACTPLDRGDPAYGLFAGGMTPKERWVRIRPPGVWKGRPRQPIRHGTEAGYKAHWKRGEETCPACRAAHVTQVIARRSRPQVTAARVTACPG